MRPLNECFVELNGIVSFLWREMGAGEREREREGKEGLREREGKIQRKQRWLINSFRYSLTTTE